MVPGEDHGEDQGWGQLGCEVIAFVRGSSVESDRLVGCDGSTLLMKASKVGVAITLEARKLRPGALAALEQQQHQSKHQQTQRARQQEIIASGWCRRQVPLLSVAVCVFACLLICRFLYVANGLSYVCLCLCLCLCVCVCLFVSICVCICDLSICVCLCLSIHLQSINQSSTF